MNADRIQIQEGPSRVFQNRKGESTQLMEDNRVQSALQAKMVETMQRDGSLYAVCRSENRCHDPARNPRQTA